MRVPFRLQIAAVYTALLILFAIVLVVVVAAVLNRLVDARSLRAIPAALGNRSLAELSAVELAEIVRESRLAERQQLVRVAVRVVAIVLLLISVAGAVCAWMVAGQMLRPLARITAHARAASVSTLSDRIALGGPDDELKELADTYDALLGRLAAAFTSQRHFSAQVSHELRTPLAVVRAEADVLLGSPNLTDRERQFATRVLEAATRNESLVEALLVLSHAESRLIDRTEVDVGELVGDAVGDVVPVADAHGVRLDMELAEARVAGDPVLLARMVSNLVANAIRHNHPNGWARIELCSTPTDVSLTISNSGPLVREPERLLDAFRTGGDAGSGLGLGLAIVREVVNAHGGTLEVEPRLEGGLQVAVTLPADRQPASGAAGRM